MFNSADEVIELYGDKGIRVLAVLAENNKSKEVTETLSKEMQEEAIRSQKVLDALREEAEELSKQIDENIKKAKLEVAKLRIKVADEHGLHPMLPFFFNEDTKTFKYNSELIDIIEGVPLAGSYKEVAEEVREGTLSSTTSEESLVDFKEMLSKAKTKGSVH